MCKEISVITGYDRDVVLAIAVDTFRTLGNNPEIVANDIDDNLTEVFIMGIHGKCTCNLTDEEKIKILDFILKISDRIY
jgi:hypothetical protein